MQAVHISTYVVLFAAIVSEGPAHAHENSAQLAAIEAAVNQNTDRLASLTETLASLTETLADVKAYLSLVAHKHISDGCELNGFLYPKDTTVDDGPCHNKTCSNGKWIVDRFSRMNPLCCRLWAYGPNHTEYPDGGTVEGDSCKPTCTKGEWTLGKSECCEGFGKWYTPGSKLKLSDGYNGTCEDGIWNVFYYTPVLQFDVTPLPMKMNVEHIIRYNPGIHHHNNTCWDDMIFNGRKCDYTNLDDINWDGMNHWVDSLDKLIERYEPYDYSNSHFINCNNDHRADLSDREVCQFDPIWLGDKCTKAEDWGYTSIYGSSPCVILQMGEVAGWTPDVYQSIEELPADMPKDLKEHIKMKTDDNGGNVPRMVWVHCKCENPAHEEYIHEIEYTPWQGFPEYYFPYQDRNYAYLNPIVAVRFDAPEYNIPINIECKSYAKNITQNRKNQLGVIYFELQKIG